MIESGAAKVGDNDSIIVQPSQQEMQFGASAYKMEDDKQPSDE